MKRILAISLLCIFLSGQFNLTWATHFCGSFEVDNSVTLGKANLSCGMEEVSCCSENIFPSETDLIKSEECCSNDFHSADSDDYFNKTENSNEKQLVFTASFIISFLDVNPKSDRQDYFVSSSPQLILPDRQVLYQTFLL